MTELNVASGIHRHLDGLEKAFWLLDQHRSTHFSIVAEIEGNISEEAWRNALNQVARATPLVGSRIHLDSSGKPYFSTPEQGDVMMAVVHGDVDDWQKHVSAELGAPFESSVDAMLRGRLLQEGERSVLILTFHHSLSDGSSAAFFLRNVLHVAGGGLPVVSQNTVSLEQAVNDKGWGDADIPGDSDPRLPVAEYGPPRTAPPTVVSRALSAQTTAALRERARKEGSTVHAALSVAAAQAFEIVHPDFETIPPRVFSPIDARRRILDDSDALGVFVTGIVTRSDDGVTGFWELARNITSKLATLADPAALASKVRLVRTVMADVSSAQTTADIWAQVFGAEIILTNLASIDMPAAFGDLQLKHVWGPAMGVGLKQEQTVGVCTVGGVMHLLHTTFNHADGFLDQMVGALVAGALGDEPA